MRFYFEPNNNNFGVCVCACECVRVTILLDLCDKDLLICIHCVAIPLLSPFRVDGKNKPTTRVALGRARYTALVKSEHVPPRSCVLCWLLRITRTYKYNATALTSFALENILLIFDIPYTAIVLHTVEQ